LFALFQPSINFQLSIPPQGQSRDREHRQEQELHRPGVRRGRHQPVGGARRGRLRVRAPRRPQQPLPRGARGRRGARQREATRPLEELCGGGGR